MQDIISSSSDTRLINLIITQGWFFIIISIINIYKTRSFRCYHKKQNYGSNIFSAENANSKVYEL